MSRKSRTASYLALGRILHDTGNIRIRLSYDFVNVYTKGYKRLLHIHTNI